MKQEYIIGDVVMYDNKIMVIKEPRDGMERACLLSSRFLLISLVTSSPICSHFLSLPRTS